MPEPRIRAGQLRHRIQLVQPSTVVDTAGGVSPDQGDVFATVWASVEALSGRELYAAQQKVSQVTHKVTIRWMGGIRSSQRVWFNDRQLDIMAVENPDGRHIMLILLCIEREDSSHEEGGGGA